MIILLLIIASCLVQSLWPTTWRSVQKSPKWLPITRKASALTSISMARIRKVNIFKYLGTIVALPTKDPSIIQDYVDINSPFKLTTIWGDRNIALRSIIRLMCTIVISKLWTLTADIVNRIQATQIICFCKLLDFSYKENIINEKVKNRIWHGSGPCECLIFTVKRCQLR